MPIPVIICDDSAFARKQVARALPRGWDVSVTFAENGERAIEAIKAGQGDILFLDLTMPGMDGFDVLEFIRSHDLPTLPIVISGDIQPESRKRVMQLGAVAFIRKPVDAAELEGVLDDYGVLSVLTGGGAAAVDEPAVAFDDWCQEIANVAMGRAADLLAKYLGSEVVLSIPTVKLLEVSELQMLLSSMTADDRFSLVSQGFTGSGVAGEALLLFYDTDIGELASLMGYTVEERELSAQEALMDASNVLIGAFLRGITEQLDIAFSYGHPRTRLHERGTGCVSAAGSASSGEVLTIQLGYAIGEKEIQGEQLVLLTERAVDKLRLRAEYALG